MTRAYISPMGDPGFANATASLADAFFPSAKSGAQAKMLGAQYQDELASARHRNAQAAQVEDQNNAIAGLADVFTDPRALAILRAGLGNSDQMAGALGKFQEQGFRSNSQAAVDAGNMQGASDALIPLANGPIDLTTVQDGVAFNKHRENAPLTNTAQTLAEIITEHAQAGAYGASANASNASAENSRASASKTRDEQAHPERYHFSRGSSSGATGSKPVDVKPSDINTMKKLVEARLPSGAQFKNEDIAATVARASELYATSRNAGSALDQAFNEILQVAPGQGKGPAMVSHRPPGGVSADKVAHLPLGALFDEAARAGAQPTAPAPAAAALPVAAPAPQQTKVLNGKTYVKINGQWFEQ